MLMNGNLFPNTCSTVIIKLGFQKGFPLNASLDKLIAYFEKEHGSVETCFMRRNPDRKFKVCKHDI